MEDLDSAIPPDIVREGNSVRMPTEVFDDLIARLLAAEGQQRSWWRPFGGR